MNRRPRQPRGFAMLLALAMLGLVAMLLLFLAHYFAYEQQRTRAAVTDAQLSQILFAASQDALTHAKSWPATAPTETWKLDLPAPLAADGANVSLTTASTPDGATINIDAHLNQQQAAQTLHFHRAADQWQLTAAEMK